MEVRLLFLTVSDATQFLFLFYIPPGKFGTEECTLSRTSIKEKNKLLYFYFFRGGIFLQSKVVMLAEDTETIINFSKYHIGDWAELYTTDKIVMKRYEKFCEKHPDVCKLISEDKYSMTFSVHPKCAGIYPRAPRKSHFTPEQQLENVERLKRYREKQLLENNIHE